MRQSLKKGSGMVSHRWIISGKGDEFKYDFGWNGETITITDVEDAKRYIQELQTSYQKELSSIPLPKQSIGLDKNTIEKLREDIRLTFVNFLAVKDNQYRMIQVFGALESRNLLHPSIVFDDASLVHDQSLTANETWEEYSRIAFSFLLVSAHKLDPSSFEKYAGQNEFLLTLIQSYDAYRSYIDLREKEINGNSLPSVNVNLSSELKEVIETCDTANERLRTTENQRNKVEKLVNRLETRVNSLDTSLTEQIDSAIAASKSEALTHSAADLWKTRVRFSYSQFGLGMIALATLFYHSIDKLILYWPNISNELDKFSEGQLYRPTVIVAGIAALTAFFTLARIFYRIAISGLETAADAAERRALVQTFIALEGEGKLNADQDRELILRALFRPGPQMGAEQDPSLSFVDALISRLTAK